MAIVPFEAVEVITMFAELVMFDRLTVLFVETVNTVTPLAWSARFPELSAVVTTPVIPETTPLSALIVEGIVFP
jgi:hypothetical protein